MKIASNLKSYVIMTVINAILLLITAFAGLFIPTTYVDFVEPLHLAESQGQDFTTLFVGLPLLVLALLWTRRGDIRGPIFWAGAMGYFLYVYLIYAYGGVYNVYFFGYVAVCGLSLYTLIGLLTGIDSEKVRQVVSKNLPAKAVAIFFGVTALLLTVMWGAMAAAGIAARQTADANIIIVTDFIVLIPAFGLAATWLWREKLWGIILAGVLLVQAVTLGISIAVGQVIAFFKGVEPAWELAGFFLVFTVVGAAVAIPYIRAFKNKGRIK